ncbi:hypothetical protein M9Y10_001518 [Tritrichomonas musculus]|uniref:Protein kinase domain-containing protein n=1 Tax=Tritrichomonas musculus TaxID=1915356 RepID=A0ABR2L7A2_9EUKA
MKYLHQHGILHRDLKPENILLDENFYPKISVIFTRSIQLTMSGVRGTPFYMAPEMIRGERCGTGVDVYSFAIIIYELMTGDVPFRHIGEQLTVYRIWNEVNSGHRPILRDNISQILKDLITACWSPNPSERPTFEEIFELLSSDFSFSQEDLDEEEVNQYLQTIREMEENNPQPAVEQNPQPAAEQNPQPAAEQNPQPAAVQNPQPAAEQNPQPAVEQNPQPAVEQNPQPAAEQNPQPAAEQNPQPAAEQNPQPAAEQNPQPAAVQNPQPAAVQNPQPAAVQNPQPATVQNPQPAAEPNEKDLFIDRLLNPIREKFQTNDLNYLLYAACESGNSNLVRNLISNEAIDINSRIIPF